LAMDLLQASAVALYVLVAVMWVRMRGYAAARGRAAAALRGLLALAGAVYVLLAGRATLAVFSAVLSAWPL
jgi:hypothetical protein